MGRQLYSYFKNVGRFLFKSIQAWLGPKRELFEKVVELSKEATPQKYQEFYEEWMKTYQNAISNFYHIHNVESSKETFEKLLLSAEESNMIYRSWIADLEKNSRAAHDLLKGEPDPAKYKYEIF